MKEIKHTKRMYYHLPKMNPSATTSKGKHSNQNLDIGHEWKSMKIITFNRSGLRNTKKRNYVFKILKKEKADIIALQETYLLGKEKPMIDLGNSSTQSIIKCKKRRTSNFNRI